MSASTPPATDAPAARGPLLVVFLTVFIDLLGFGIVLPVLPRQVTPYLDAIGLPPLGGGAGGAVIGLLFAVFSLMQFLFSPIWGRISDRVGRRPILLLSLTGSVVFYALYGYAVSVPVDPPPTRAAALTALGLILLARIGAGIAGASVGTAAAVIADCTTPENRARGMALIGIAFGGGFTLGPLIAYFGLTVFDQARWGVGAIASLLSLVALLIAALVFRETRRPGAKAAKEFPSVGRSVAVLRMPTVGGLVLVYFLSIVAMAGFESTLALFTEKAFGMADDANFLVFAAIGFVLLLAGGCYRPLAKRLPEWRLRAAGVALLRAAVELDRAEVAREQPGIAPGELGRRSRRQAEEPIAPTAHHVDGEIVARVDPERGPLPITEREPLPLEPPRQRRMLRAAAVGNVEEVAPGREGEDPPRGMKRRGEFETDE